MNYPIFIRAAVLGAVAALPGCSAPPDCTSALETADAAALSHQPPGAWIDAVDTACRDAAIREWTTSVQRDCAPVFGFHAALNSAEKPAECVGAEFESAWSLGAMLAEMRDELGRIEQRLDDDSLAPETRRDLVRRLVVIGRDLPQIEALARMDGYLPPAEIPEPE